MEIENENLRFLLSALRRTEDGLRSSVDASIGKIETGEETAERFQRRMVLTAERVWKIRNILETGKVDPQEWVSRLWDKDVEEEYEEDNDDDDEKEDEA